MHGVVHVVSSGDVAERVEESEWIIPKATVNSGQDEPPGQRLTSTKIHWIAVSPALLPAKRTHAKETESTSSSSGVGMVLNLPTGLALLLSAQFTNLRVSR